MNQPVFVGFEFEASLWAGNPLEPESRELTGAGYSRVWFGELAPAFYGVGWGVGNKHPIEFPRAEEDWEVTHIGFSARNFDVLISTVPISDAVLFADMTTSTLGVQETKIVPKGHSIVLAVGSIFLLCGIVAEVANLDGQSKCVN